jgi:hypothetical protein
MVRGTGPEHDKSADLRVSSKDLTKLAEDLDGMQDHLDKQVRRMDELVDRIDWMNGTAPPRISRRPRSGFTGTSPPGTPTTARPPRRSEVPRERDELSALMKRLAHDGRVYVRSGQLPSTTGGIHGIRAAVAAEVHVVLRRLWRDWERYATGSEGLSSAQRVEAALETFTADRAAVLMGRFASTGLVWPSATFMERAEADAVGRRVVELLGPDAHWWSNYDSETEGAYTCISACTFDGLVTGTDGHRFVVLIQVGED